ncbi:hypothetical protein COCSADRAFT_275220 [Bipolaris sorokiniana ND90Pr]|uniref:Uncharacterized protein n=1 Tax=Cochliobolus sativus (strain ND90Pr / ATCC 201652) TaxID=665912 RepID=M2SNC6_COCSN|nr:uncharacterized protein COCSADRAFT_275220 [Bipolaris sorokiniana ND90Pr]EMD68663.1 hypothetical protein COCSADRAFT_275220 [Bipolaris sorokiniana ND90Pr]
MRKENIVVVNKRSASRTLLPPSSAAAVCPAWSSPATIRAQPSPSFLSQKTEDNMNHKFLRVKHKRNVRTYIRIPTPPFLSPLLFLLLPKKELVGTRKGIVSAQSRRKVCPAPNPNPGADRCGFARPAG